MNTIIEPIASYADKAAIRAFVESVLAAHPVVTSWEGAPDPTRLVVVKPNWVQEAHEYRPDVWEPVISNPALVLAVVDGLAKRLGGVGTICVCDAPHTYADFVRIVGRGDLSGGLAELRRRWPELTIEVIDLRREHWIRKEEVVVERRPNTPDPRGYVRLDLSTDSLFYGHDGEGRYYGADYDSKVVNSHHHGRTHEYLLAGTPMRCDLFVNLPKLKTHKKTGITCCLKNLVGINGDKNWLPHHTEGSPRNRGDEYPDERLAHRVEQLGKSAVRRVALSLPLVGTWLYRKARNAGKRVLGDSETTVRNGNWSGNDTCWRMVLDLNRALLYGNSDGSWREKGAAKPYLAIVDGVVGGEGNGPLCPDPVSSGLLVAGDDPVAVDAVCARLIGLDPRQLPLLARAVGAHRWPITMLSNWAEFRATDGRVGRELGLDALAPAVPGGFRPHFGWANAARAA